MPRAGTRPSQPRLDDLTGLRNTRALREELDERAKAGAAGVPLAIVVVDFDRLGALNLRYDRSVGDAVLWGGASVARDEAPSPRLVFRYDDDDLVLLVPGDEEDGREVAERIRERIAARNRDLPAVTVSCGVAAAETPAHAWRALESACASLRTAKRAGGNRVAIGTHRKGNGNGNGNGPSGGMDTALRAALALAVTTLEVRNPETADHSDDVVTLAETIGRRFGMGDYELDRLTAGAQLHDVGKLAIPTEILNKPGPLNKNEWAVIREHTVIGERILRSVPEMAEIATIVRHSHEHFDGSGYPDGLAGEEIPLASRIILCADAFHAMRSDRSYRRGRPTKDAIAELVACSGSQFDPRVVEEMIAIARDVRTARGVGRAGRRRIRRLAALLAALAVGGGSAYAASDDVRWIVDGVFDVMVPNVIAQQSGGSGATGGLTASPVEAVSRIVPVEFKATADSVDLTRTGVSADRSVEPQVSDEPSIAPERPAPAKPEPPASVPEPVDEAFEPLVPIASPLPSVDEPHVTSEAPVGPAPLEVVAVPESLPPLVDLAPAAEPAPELAPTAELASKPAPAAAATPAAVGNPRREPPGLVKLPVLDDTPPADDDARPQPPAVGNPHGEPPALGNPHEEPPAVGSPLEELPELGEPPAVGNPHGEPPALGNPHGEPPGLVRLPELDPPPSLEPLPELEHGDPPAVGNPHGEPPAVGNPHVEDPPGLSVVEGTPILGDLSTAPPATGNPHDEPPAVGNPHEEPPAVGNPHDDDPPADDDEGGDPPAVGNPHDDPPAVGNPHGEPPAVGNPHVDPEPVLDAVSEPESVPTPPPGIPEHVLESHPVFGPGMELFTPAVTKPGKRRGQPTP